MKFNYNVIRKKKLFCLVLGLLFPHTTIPYLHQINIKYKFRQVMVACDRFIIMEIERKVKSLLRGKRISRIYSNYMPLTLKGVQYIREKRKLCYHSPTYSFCSKLIFNFTLLNLWRFLSWTQKFNLTQSDNVHT